MEMFILIVITIVSVICTWLLIRNAFRLGNRAVIASEFTADAMQVLVDSLSPEAKHRMIEARDARHAKQQAALVEVRRQQAKRSVLVVVGLVVFFIVLAIVRAQAADSVPTQMIGAWCYSDKDQSGQAVYFPKGRDQCDGGDATMIIRADSYDGYEYGCRFTSVRTWIDRTLPLATKTPMGAPVVRIESKCRGEGCTWKERMTMHFSKGLLVVREKKSSSEVCA